MAINSLIHQHHKNVYFATNNSMSTRSQLVDKVERLGFGRHSEESFYCTSWMTGEYLRHNKITGKILVMATKSVVDAVAAVPGCVPFILEDKVVSPKVMDNESVDMSISAVIVGFESQMNYYKLSYATILLRNNPNCSFILTNADQNFPSVKYTLPGTGSICQSLISSCGRQPTIMGKPSVYFADHLIEKYHYERRRVCMVGDNLMTDILFGCNSKFSTCLVLTGVHQQTDVLSLCGPRPESLDCLSPTNFKTVVQDQMSRKVLLAKPYAPDFVLRSIADLNQVQPYCPSPLSKHDVFDASTFEFRI